MQSVLTDLAARHGRPEFEVQADFRQWERHGQESFAIARRIRWRSPLELYSRDWLERIEAVGALRAAVKSDAELSQRLDSMVGTEFWRTGRSLSEILIQRLLIPLVTAAKVYEFERSQFDALYDGIEQAILSDVVRYVDFVPINGVVLGSGVVAHLPGGLVLREMTDGEIGAALGVLAVPAERHDSPSSITVSRLNQVALVLEHEHPFVVERDMPERPVVPEVLSVDEAAERLVNALRIVRGGSCSATRSLRMLHPAELEATGSAQAHLTQLGTVDLERPVVLFTEDLDDLGEVFGQLANPGPPALQVALRRLVYAGSRTRVEDQLIDLIICAEALFIHQIGTIERPQSAAVAHGAGLLFRNDPVLGIDSGSVEEFMRAAYRRRNIEVHGDPGDAPPPVNLRNEPVADLRAMVQDLDRVMRRACRLVLSARSRLDVS